MLGGIIVEISVAGLLLLFYLNNSIYGSRLADEALAVAQSGINDAIVQVILNKNLINVSGETLPVGNGVATTDISVGSGAELQDMNKKYTVDWPEKYRVLLTRTMSPALERLGYL